MRVILKIISGEYQGRMVLLQPGQTLKVGRTEWADFAIPHDNHLSGVHFAVECERHRCRVRDLESTNGTKLNDETVFEAELADGDTIFAGRTSFLVQVEEPAPVTPPANAPSGADVRLTAKPTDDSAAEPPEPEPPEPVAPAPRASLDGAAIVTTPDQAFPFPPAILLADSGQRPYSAALLDEDASVARAALWAAAWTGQKWLLEYCRHVAIQPQQENWDALLLLAILGQPSDIDRVLRIGRTSELGSRRFEIYAAFGHPRVIKDLLLGMENRDANTAVACGAAFAKITGVQIDSEQRRELPPKDGKETDEFEREFATEAKLPDGAQARQHWNSRKDQYEQGTRWRGGFDLTRGCPLEIYNQLDMESRWMACLRAHHEGNWSGGRVPPMWMLPPPRDDDQS